jgi:hypothetical protein
MPVYATWNPDDKSADIVLSNGNLTTTQSGTNYRSARANMGKSSGRWYWEVTIEVGINNMVGVGTSAVNLETWLGSSVYGWSYGENAGRKWHSGASVAYGAVCTAGDVIGIALDLDNGKIWWSKNGAWQASGNPETGANPAFTGLSGTLYPMITHRYLDQQATTNFGASAFSYSVPSGYNAGVYEEVGEQTKLEDASLDLSAYYRGQSDFSSFLRAHDGLELLDLQGRLEAAGWNIEDLAGFLSAYYESMDDAGMDLATWGTHYDDPKLILAAWFQHLENIRAALEARYEGFSSGKARLEAAAFAFKNLRTWLAANGQAVVSMAARLGAGKAAFRSLELFLYVTNGIVLNNLGCFLFADSGLVQRDMSMFLRVVSSVPVFSSVVAQRVSAVVSEVS